MMKQKFENWEMIIVNDGSTDNSEKIAGEYAAKDSRIKVVSQPNAGLSAGRNTGIHLARGKFLHFLDADDLVNSGCYETIYAQVRKGEHDIIVSSYGYFKYGKGFHSYYFGHAQLAIDRLFSSNIAPPVAFFVSREMVKRVGHFDLSLKSCEDWDFWIRAAKAGARIQTLPDVLVMYRYVTDSMSRNAFRMYDALKEVSLRAPRKDERLIGDYPLNRDYAVDVPGILKVQLFRCLGVSIMQGKIQESVELFFTEKKCWHWEYTLHDFGHMASYLSFRYFTARDEIENLVQEVRPLFKEFFGAIGLTEREITKALKIVFDAQIKKRNHYRYGRYLGALVNRLTY